MKIQRWYLLIVSANTLQDATYIYLTCISVKYHQMQLYTILDHLKGLLLMKPNHGTQLEVGRICNHFPEEILEI
jgi:hypothetical protein